MKTIKFYNLSDLNKKYTKRFVNQFYKLNKIGRYILGANTEKFEKNFAKFCKAKYAIGVGNCYDALFISFKAYKEMGLLKDGDEVIVPTNTYIASVLSITGANLKPVFVEPDLETFNLKASIIEKYLTKKTKAILAVDLYGHPADLINIKKIARKKNLVVIEDAAQSQGAKIKNKMIGSIADATCFSFFPGKLMGAFGDAGAITTNDIRLYKIAKSIRNFGEKNYYNYQDRKYENIYHGVNSRMDELQAIILNEKLKTFSEEQRKRAKIIKYYLKHIRNKVVELPIVKKGFLHAWHLFVIKTSSRNKLMKYLNKNGIQTMLHYPIPPYRQKMYKKSKIKSKTFSDNLNKKLLSLPVNSSLSLKEAKYVVDKINSF
jgi:dTDP-4-amino-4,6-dideoxygalactose transaminase|tara:strand:+ start:330 stop:1454 length:1125 start_codon:yes stop_codon:yes gene_type:complete